MDTAEITALGQSLRLIDQTLLNQDHTTTKKRVWYQGGEPYFDVFIELEHQEVDWFQVTLRGRSLSWYRQGNRWHTGSTNELQANDLTLYPASKVIESDRQPDRDFFELVAAILRSRPDEVLFKQLLTIFRTTPAPNLSH